LRLPDNFKHSAIARGGDPASSAVRTCSTEDLIVLKLFASRPLDIRDAEGVAARNADQLDWAYIEDQLRPLAEVKQDSEILTTLGRLRKS
jgi:hypothetical protein